uniref:Uncharacterized protein n=1 Tax=Rhizophora mucronata TaxID=61149 RepID=A0A2P2P7D7_RHIMU
MARNLSSFNWERDWGKEPKMRPGTMDNSAKAESFPMEGSSRPVRPGEPALGSPRLRAITLLESQ